MLTWFCVVCGLLAVATQILEARGGNNINILVRIAVNGNYRHFFGKYAAPKIHTLRRTTPVDFLRRGPRPLLLILKAFIGGPVRPGLIPTRCGA